ncbi:MAG: uracil phosphoribosyltransferase [Simkania sp.]|nr:uracil phosphoribosyltransferase [Simkania sp.]
MKYIILSFSCFANIAGHAQTQALNQLVYEIRDPKTDALHFRNALETIGEYLALDVLEELNTKEATVQTLTGADATHSLVDEIPVLVTILRAGLPLNSGVQKVFPHSEVGFLAMSRNETTLKAQVDYIALPNLKNRRIILTDTMLATGGSLLDAIRIIKQYQPKTIFVLAAIASKPGIARITQYDPSIKIFAAAIDPSLNDKGYIIPGLGDAGDRSYGDKYYLPSSESEHRK